MSGPRTLAIVIVAGLLAVGCEGQEMDDQPKGEAYESSKTMSGGQFALRPPQGTVAREDPQAIPPRPARMTRALLEHGRERFDVFCSPCHGYSGYGDGMIVQRGFPRPPSYHTDRLREAPDSHFYDVITNGYGVMFAYDSRVPPADRWAIVAYIRALQLSQNAQVADLPPGTGLPEEPAP